MQLFPCLDHLSGKVQFSEWWFAKIVSRDGYFYLMKQKNPSCGTDFFSLRDEFIRLVRL